MKLIAIPPADNLSDVSPWQHSTVPEKEPQSASAGNAEAEGLLENVEGKCRITEVTVRPRITVKSEADIEPTREIIEGAEAQCFMSNSVKAKVTVIPELAAIPVIPELAAILSMRNVSVK